MFPDLVTQGVFDHFILVQFFLNFDYNFTTKYNVFNTVKTRD